MNCDHMTERSSEFAYKNTHKLVHRLNLVKINVARECINYLQSLIDVYYFSNVLRDKYTYSGIVVTQK